MKKRVIVLSMIFKFLERVGVKLLNLIVGIILARYIAPEDFGLVAIIAVLEIIVMTLTESGLTTALVQSNDLQEEDYSTVFFACLFLALIFVSVIFIYAPAISKFYNTDKLVLPLRFYMLLVVVNTYNGIKLAKWMRNMQFRAQMACQILSAFFSGIIGIYMAIMSCGLWTLVVYLFNQALFLTICMFFVDRWIPSFTFNWTRAKRYFSFGVPILAVNLLTNIYKSIQPLIIGKKFALNELAYYDRGKGLIEVVTVNLDNTIQSVMLPVLSKEQENFSCMQSVVKRTISSGIFFLTPILIGLSIFAYPIIKLLLSEKWLFSVQYMQIFAFGALFSPVVSTLMTALIAIGEVKLNFKIELFRKIVQILILIYSIVAYDTIMAIVYGYVIGCFIDVILVVNFTRNIIGYGFYKFINDSWKIYVVSAIMGLSIFLLDQQMILYHESIRIFIGFAFGISIYGVLCYFLRVESFYYFFNIAKGRMQKKYQ